MKLCKRIIGLAAFFMLAVLCTVCISAATIQLSITGSKTLTANDSNIEPSQPNPIGLTRTYTWTIDSGSNVVQLTRNGNTAKVEAIGYGTATVYCNVSLNYMVWDSRLSTYRTYNEYNIVCGFWEITVSNDSTGGNTGGNTNSDVDSGKEGIGINRSGTCGTNLTWTLYNDGELIVKGTGAMTDWVDSRDVPWKSVRSSIKKVTIKQGVTTIGEQAFKLCSNLTKVNLSNTVVTLREGSFVECDALVEVTLPESVTSIEGGVFGSCDNLKKVTILSRTTTFGSYPSFSNLSSSFAIYGYYGSTAQSYAQRCGIDFVPLDYGDVVDGGNCGTNLTWKLYDNGALVISGTGKMTNWAYFTSAPWFSQSSSVKSITIANGVTSIGDYAFVFCDNLPHMTIPDSVTSIGKGAFSQCTKLESITIPAGVTTIGEDAFDLCWNLSKFTVNKGNKYFSNDSYGVLFNKDKTKLICYPAGNTRTSYTVPAGVTSIQDRAFRFCGSTDITLPSGLLLIGDWAFRNCYQLTSIRIPATVTSIGEEAFAYCSNLTKAIIRSTNVTFGASVFDDTAASLSLYGYPGSTTETYAKAHSHAFVELGKTPTGDITEDESVDINDALKLFQYSLMPDLYPISYSGDIDFNHDGSVNIADALKLFQHSLMPDLYPL